MNIKKNIVLGVAAALVNLGFVDKTDKWLAVTDGKVFYMAKAFTGDLIEKWPTGAVFSIVHYRAGVADGSSEKYGLNGQLLERGNFRLGKKDGLQQTWFEEGPKKTELHFKNGVLEGTQTEWHMNGSLFRKQVYAHGREVEKKILYPNGNIFTNYAKRDGRIYGLDGGSLCQEPAKKEGEK